MSAAPMKTKPQVETGRFLAGGLMTAVIAAVAGLVTRGVVNAILEKDTQLGRGDLAVPTSLGADTYELLTISQTLLISFGAGVAATLVLYLFIMAVPRPRSMFNTLAVLFLIATLVPILTFDDPPVNLAMQVGLATLNVVVGLTILGLLSGVARSTVRFVQVPEGQQPGQQPPPGYQQAPGQQPPPGYGGPGQPGAPGQYPQQ
jgi:hypothetical protein